MALLTQLFSQALAIILSKNIFFIGLGIFGIGFIIAFHELGHLLFCKLFGIKVPSFSIGMGPKIIRYTFGTTEYSISLIPLGGYVEPAQAGDEAGTQQSTQEHYLETRPYWQKMLIMSSGIMFNLIFAYTTFVALYFFGMPNTPVAYPENAIPVIQSIIADGPAAHANLQIGDRIIAINNTPINNNIETVFALIAPRANQETPFTIERNKDKVELSITLGERMVGKTTTGFLGAGFETTAIPALPFSKALKRGIKRTNAILAVTIQSFKGMLTRRSIDGLGGPIMIISQTIEHAERGIKIFFAFLALISINLAILNLIPLPILDGGQALFATIEALLRRQLPSRVREYLALGTWVIFILLILYLSFKDIKFIRALRNHSATQEVSK